MGSQHTKDAHPVEQPHSLREALDAVPAIAILRAASAARFAEVASTLHRGGVRVVEFTLTTPGALDALRELSAGAPDALHLGVGSVTTAAEVEQAAAAGARYVVSPAVVHEVIAEALKLQVPIVPGAFTPTEILSAWQAGAPMVKLFPAGTGGPAHLRAVRAPLPQVPLLPTGGIGIAEAAGYLEAGALAVGLGSPLLGDACEGGALTALRERTERLVEAIA